MVWVPTLLQACSGRHPHPTHGLPSDGRPAALAIRALPSASFGALAAGPRGGALGEGFFYKEAPGRVISVLWLDMVGTDVLLGVALAIRDRDGPRAQLVFQGRVTQTRKDCGPDGVPARPSGER